MIQHYTITPSQSGHFFNIQLRVNLTQGIHECWLPIWIVGSYSRRDYSKHLTELTASQQQSALPIRYLTPSRWAITVPNDGEVILNYRLYARDISVRGNYLDHERAIFNPCPSCMVFDENAPFHLTFDLQGKHQDWQIAGATQSALGHYVFDNHDMVADTPFILAKNMVHRAFEVGSVMHDFYITGSRADDDIDRLIQDSQIMCQSALAMFGEFPKVVKRYQFLLHLTGSTRGGLEHKQSTLLMERYKSMPKIGQSALPKTYVDLMGLIIHEYFHTWNVKHLKPKTYQPYDLRAEQPDELLWFFEGYTAYFDNYLMLKSGVISPSEYLKLIESDHTRHLAQTGRFRQTLVQSSIEAWTKYYNPNEIGAQLGTSYYIQGSLAALCLDIWLFEHGFRLEQIIVHIWRNYRDTEMGLTEARYFELVREILPQTLWAEFEHLVHTLIHTTTPLDLQSALAKVNVNVQLNAKYEFDFGFEWRNRTVALLDEHSAAAHAGIANGDKVLMLDEITMEELEADGGVGQRYHVGDVVRLHVERDGQFYDFEFTLQNPKIDQAIYHLGEPVSSFFKP